MDKASETGFRLPQIPSLRNLPVEEVHRLHKDIVLIGKLRRSLEGTRSQIANGHQSVIDSADLLDRLKKDLR